MATFETVLKVFVASPSDVSEERAILEEVIRELNITWSTNLGIRLDLIRWETHAYPGIGVDAQDVVNAEIVDDYDIFIGIMWTRFGTPTAREKSGTAEEFNRAYERFIAKPNEIRIMFYFNESPPQGALSNLDPEQLLLIKQFRARLGEKGTLYWTYNSKQEFAQIIRIHLSRQVQEWGKSWGVLGESSKKRESVAVEAENIPQEDEEEGFLDLVEEGQVSFETLAQVAQRLNDATSTWGEKTRSRTTEITKANEAGASPSQLKKLINRAADDLEQFTNIIEAEIPIFASSSSNGFSKLGRAASLWSEFKPENKKEVETVFNQLVSLEETLEQAETSMIGLREALAKHPRMTTAYNRSKKRALSVIDHLNSEMSSARNLAKEVNEELKRIIDSAE